MDASLFGKETKDVLQILRVLPTPKAIGHEELECLFLFWSYYFADGRFVGRNDLAFHAEIVFVLKRKAQIFLTLLAVHLEEYVEVRHLEERKFRTSVGFSLIALHVDGCHAKEIIITVLRHDFCHGGIHLHVVERISKYQRFRDDYRMSVGEEPSDEQYCAFLGIAKPQLKELRSFMFERETYSFEDIAPGTDDLTLGESIPDDFDLEEAVADEDAKSIIWNTVSNLNQEEAAVVTGYYKNDETLDTLADRLSTSKERIRQLNHNAIKTLKRNEKLKELAEIYGFGCSRFYHWGLGQWKNTGYSSTEFMAIKRIEMQEGQKENIKLAKELNASVPIIADGFRKNNKGYTPCGVRLLESRNREIDTMLQELNELATAKKYCSK